MFPPLTLTQRQALRLSAFSRNLRSFHWAVLHATKVSVMRLFLESHIYLLSGASRLHATNVRLLQCERGVQFSHKVRLQSHATFHSLPLKTQESSAGTFSESHRNQWAAICPKIPSHFSHRTRFCEQAHPESHSWERSLAKRSAPVHAAATSCDLCDRESRMGSQKRVISSRSNKINCSRATFLRLPCNAFATDCKCRKEVVCLFFVTSSGSVSRAIRVAVCVVAISRKSLWKSQRGDLRGERGDTNINAMCTARETNRTITSPS